MKTCFVCGAFADGIGVWLDEPLCKAHSGLNETRYSAIVSSRAALEREWQRLRQIVNWHTGSGYARDREMAERVKGVLS